MQLVTKYGAFALCCATEQSRLDPDWLWVESTNRRELVSLAGAYPKLRWCELTSQAEGRWRLTVPKTMWAHVLQDLVLDIDYGPALTSQEDDDLQRTVIDAYFPGLACA